MTKSLLSWVNWLDGASLSASSEAADMPVTYLVTQQGSQVWRALDTTAQFQADLGTDKPIRLLVLALTTLSATAKFRLRLSSVEAGGNERLDTRQATSGFILADDGSILLAEDGTPLLLGDGGEVDLDANVDPIARQIVFVLDRAITARHVTVDIVDDGNAADYIDIGFGWLGDAAQLSLLPMAGAQLGSDDLSTGTASLGGQTLIDERPEVRVWSGQWDFLEEEEVYRSVRPFLAVASKRNVVIVPDADSPYRNAQTILGLVQKSKRVTNTTFVYHGLPIEIRERL